VTSSDSAAARHYGQISKQRGQPSNRRKPESIRAEALAIIAGRSAEVVPTLAAETLRDIHGVCLGRETARLLIAQTARGIRFSQNAVVMPVFDD
jgi:hypothetical protein